MEQVTDFMTIEFLTLGIFGKDYDGANDDKLYEITDQANQQVSADIAGYVDTPLEAGSETFRQCRNAARVFGKLLWAEFVENYDAYEKNMELYDKKISSIIELYKTQANSRTKRVVVGTDYTTRRLYSQVRRY